MTDQHPITPPPELVQKWVTATEFNDCTGALPTNFEQRICTAAARWGADQELEACCEYMQHEDFHGFATELRAARRPKPPSLKEQALALLQPGEPRLFNNEMQDTIRRALEQLDD